MVGELRKVVSEICMPLQPRQAPGERPELVVLRFAAAVKSQSSPASAIGLCMPRLVKVIPMPSNI
ncbi:hypothetical protein AC579_10470 [Pseudocercospora musae]|uniref:Uncharacterized protein n=1 Tax=Pseudocercospora musae TaxID=113226 RepID=A0A139IE55_9PEZI|nr:hypothetical protein AC579_10470 [Pseudocercospora musae]